MVLGFAALKQAFLHCLHSATPCMVSPYALSYNHECNSEASLAEIPGKPHAFLWLQLLVQVA